MSRKELKAQPCVAIADWTTLARRMPLEQDTGPAERARYYALLAKAGVVGRARILASLTGGVRALAEAGIRRAHPGLSEPEVRAALTDRLYGPEVARRLHGETPGSR